MSTLCFKRRVGWPSAWLAGLLLCLLGFPETSRGQLPRLEVTSLSPSAAQAGSTPSLEFHGARLDELRGVTFSRLGAEATAETSPAVWPQVEPTRTGKFKVAVDADMPPGLVEVRALGRFGLSNPRRMLVTRKPVAVAATENIDALAALPLTGQHIVLDHCAAAQRCYYRLSLAAGQCLECVGYARPLDSRANLGLVLSDPTGQEVARGRAVGGWAARVKHRAEVTGDYLLTAHDGLFRGGREYPFVLEAHVADQAGCELENPIANLNNTDLELDALLSPGLAGLDMLYEPGGAGRNRQPGEPVDTLAFAGRRKLTTPPIAAEEDALLSIPCVVQGDPRGIAQAESNAEAAHHDFMAAAGQELWIEVASAQWAQVTDYRLFLYRVLESPEGKLELRQVAEQDDPPSLGGPEMKILRRDPYLKWRVPEDGRYRVELRNQEVGSSAVGSSYLLHLREAEPSFGLLAYRPFPANNPAAARPMGASLMRGGTQVLHVLAFRRDGLQAAIEVSVDGLPEGVTCEPAVISSGAAATQLILRCDETAASWQGAIMVRGRAQLGQQRLRATAAVGTVTWPTSVTHNAIRSRLASDLGLAVNADDLAPLQIKLGDGQPLEVVAGGKVSIPVRVARRAGGKGELILRAQNLPANTSLAEGKRAADKSEAAAELQVKPEATPGEHTLWMQAETKLRWRANPQSLARAQANLKRLQDLGTAETEPAKRQLLDQAIAAAKKQMQELEKQTAEKEIVVWLPSTLVRIRVLPKP